MATPYKLYGKTELEYIRERITENGEKWRSDWFDGKLNSVNFEVSVHNICKEQGPQGELHRYCYNMESETLVVTTDSCSLDYLLSTILDLDVKSNSINVSGVSKSVVEECLVDLIDKLFYLSKGSHRSEAEFYCLDAEENNHIKYDYLYFDLSLGEIHLNLSVPYVFVRNISDSFKPKSQSLPSLIKSDQCDIDGFVNVQLEIGSAELDYGAITNVSPGDVIRLDSKLDMPLKIYTEDKQYICDAYLGKRGNNKAAKIILK